MGIGYPIDFQKDGEERSRYEEEESVIASRESWNIFDERKSMCRSEGSLYLWKGDRERASDGFEFEFKRERIVIVNSIDMRMWLDPTSLTNHPPNHVCVIASPTRKDPWSICKKCDEWESLPIHSEMCGSWMITPVNITILYILPHQRRNGSISLYDVHIVTSELTPLRSSPSPLCHLLHQCSLWTRKTS